MEFTPGNLVGDRYRIGRGIAPGVYRAQDTHTEREVEVRLLQPPSEIYDTECERLAREVGRGLGLDWGEVGEGALFLITDTATGRQRPVGPAPARRRPGRGPQRRRPPPRSARRPPPRRRPTRLRRAPRRRPAPPALLHVEEELPADYFSQPATITLGESGRAPPPAPSPEPSGSRRHRRLTAEMAQVLDEAQVLLADFAVAPSRKGAELKFRAGDPELGYSLIVDDPDGRYAFLEQRVTYAPHELLGQPTGWANLALAMNFANHYARGIHCVAADNRLRFRRTLWLDTGPYPFEGIELAAETELLFRGWAEVFPALSNVQGGMPWHQALEGLRAPRPSGSPSELEALAEELERDLKLRREAGRLVVLHHGQDDVELTWADGDLDVSLVVHSWSPPEGALAAVQQGRPAPAVEELLEELNQLNTGGGAALVWDPKRGVVARCYLSGRPPLRHRVLDQVLGLQALREQIQLRCIG